MSDFQPKLPACWSDDERMDYLFSAFPKNLNHNPASWKSKYNFWSELVLDVCCQCKEAAIDMDDLKNMVRRNDRYPLGFHLVCEKLFAEKQLITRSEFIRNYSPDSSSWLYWGVNLVVRKPLEWMAGKVVQSLQSNSSDIGNGEKLVCIKSLESKSKQLIELLNSDLKSVDDDLSQVLMLSSFNEKVKQVVADGDSVNLLLLYMEKTKQITVKDLDEQNDTEAKLTNNHEVKAIKFVTLNQKVVPAFTEVEKSSVRLISTRSMVIKEKEELKEESQKLGLEIRALVKKSEKRAALPILRRQKKLDKAIEEKDKALMNLDDMLDRIKQCKSDARIIGTYKKANTAIKDLMNESGLTVDETERVMNSVSDTLEEHNDIQNIISNAVLDDTTVFDADELEEEFNNLMLGSSMDDIELPDLPDFVAGGDRSKESVEKGDVVDKQKELQLS